MKRSFLFLMLLFPLATMFSSGGAYAADPDKAMYEAALKAYPSGDYYISTEVDGIKYYVNSQGEIVKCTKDDELSDCLFTINQVDGGEYATIGWQIEGADGRHFTTPPYIIIKPTCIPALGNSP